MTNDNTVFKRRSGVLLSVSSLPGPFGTGVFGPEAKAFVDKIKEMGFSYWQVLPLGPLDKGNSPYCGESAFAGNVLYIDPRGLAAEGLISEEDVSTCLYCGSPHTADYGFASEKKRTVLEKAFNSFKELPSDAPLKRCFDNFVSATDWLIPYAEYKALKELFNGTPWSEWPANGPCIDAGRKEYLEGLHCFAQFMFFRQWAEIRKYANENGIGIIGDMPLYIAYDSADVRNDVSDFLIDPDTLKPVKVAGVPPDYFSEEGQLWGNPLYDWAAMKKNGYRWWKQRVRTALELYDVVRIDHFRGLASYWAIPADAESAKAGAWEKGPGTDLFEALAEIPGYSNERLIAEDLGVFGTDVKELLAAVGLPGMRVIQFAFDESRESTNLPHNYEKNTIAYVGTHDNNTVFGWLWEAAPGERSFALRYCGFKGDDWRVGGKTSESCRAVIEAVWRSCAKTAVVALQDMLGYGRDCRMNTPGKPDGNWLFRTTFDAISQIDTDYFREINTVFGRN